MRFRKTMLRVGKYQSPDGEVVVTPERLKHWSEVFSRMKSQKIGVPVSWDHNDDPTKSVPVQLSGGKRRTASGTVGYLDDFRVSGDGRSAEIVISVPRKEDQEKVKHNLAFVSPVIFKNWKDGRGNVYEDCITHADLVQHPVDNSQGEFSVACAIRMGLDEGKPTTFRMAEESKGDRLTRVIECLKRLDIVLSDDTNAENFLEHLEQALLTAEAIEDEDMGETEVKSPELALSLDKNETPDKKTETQDNSQVKALSLEVTRWREHASAEHRGKVSSRLQSLLDSGRCTPAEYEAKKQSVDAIKLSLDEHGKHSPTQLESWIESRESVPQGTFWDGEQRTRMSQVEVVPRPKMGELTDEDSDKIVDEVFGVKS